MKRIKFLASFFILAVLVTGCTTNVTINDAGKTPAPSTTNTTQETAVTEESSLPVFFDPNTTEEDVLVNVTEVERRTVQAPEPVKNVAVEEANDDFSLTLNEPNYPTDAEFKEMLEVEKAKQISFANQFLAESNGNTKLSINMWYEPVLVKGDIVSFSAKTSTVKSDGSRNWNSEQGVNYDLDLKKAITLEHIFKADSDYVYALSVIAREQADMNNWNILEADTEAKADNYDNFLITPDGFIVIMPGGAAGSAYVSIPWTKLADFLRADFAVKL